MTFAAILLAGGSGTRMNSVTPKQFLKVNGRPLVEYSLDLFLSLPKFAQVIVVCADEYVGSFSHYQGITFALPGLRRQDSLLHGMQVLSPGIEYVCVHDTARPCITENLIEQLCEAAIIHGNAVLGMPMASTVKIVDENHFVQKTLDRNHVWEIQTPQIVRKDVLEKGFAIAQEQNITVTDDVALAELAGYPVKCIQGSIKNIKVTYPQDLEYVRAHMELELNA